MSTFREFKFKPLDDHFLLFAEETNYGVGAFGNALIPYLVLTVCHIVFISLVC